MEITIVRSEHANKMRSKISGDERSISRGLTLTSIVTGGLDAWHRKRQAKGRNSGRNSLQKAHDSSCHTLHASNRPACANTGPGAKHASTDRQVGRRGGYRVHLYCTGTGSPAVVIVGAGFSFDWGLIQPEVAKFTQVCAYDHSGIGWSDPGPRDSCSLRVEEVHAVLKKAGIQGPCSRSEITPSSRAHPTCCSRNSALVLSA
jgi:hypothetical protein